MQKKVQLRVPIGNTEAGTIMEMTEFMSLIHLHHVEYIHKSVMDQAVYSELIPDYFVGIAEDDKKNKIPAIYKLDASASDQYNHPVYRNNIDAKVVLRYDHLSSLKEVEPIWHDEELQKFIDKFTPRQTKPVILVLEISKKPDIGVESIWLDGELMKPGEVVYFLRLSDMACGHVKFNNEILKNYDPKDYLFFLTSTERDYMYFKVSSEGFDPAIEEAFSETKFSVTEIKSAFRRCTENNNSDQFWNVFFSVLEKLRSSTSIDEKKAA